MLATIDLDQFAHACPPHPRLLNLRRPELPWDPQTDGDLQLPHSLFGKIDAMLGSELLGGQCRPKIRVR
jgi:hypothetical protein